MSIALRVCMVAFLALGCGELEELRLRARLGDSSAQFRLAERLEKGAGVAADPARAAYWYRRAAQDGSAWHAWHLGRIHRRGIGVARDDSEAARWFEVAARQGVSIAQQALSGLYATGQGVPP